MSTITTQIVWARAYERALKRGETHAKATHSADQWLKRQCVTRWKYCPSTHCERREECASPHDCCASMADIRASR